MNGPDNGTVVDGALRLDSPIELPSGTRVQVIVNPIPTEAERQRAWEEWDKLCEELELDSNASRLTRDELHERR